MGVHSIKSIHLTDSDRKLLNDYQHEFPLTSRPFRTVGENTGLTEQLVIDRLKRLQSNGYISRIGPVFRCNTLGVSTLAAMSVPESDLCRVARIVNSFPEVNHNYERDHEFNLWFVIAAGSQTELDERIDEIERLTGYECLNLPMLEDYHIDLGFNLQWT